MCGATRQLTFVAFDTLTTTNVTLSNYIMFEDLYCGSDNSVFELATGSSGQYMASRIFLQPTLHFTSLCTECQMHGRSEYDMHRSFMSSVLVHDYTATSH